jgi:hypothetical protein
MNTISQLSQQIPLYEILPMIESIDRQNFREFNKLKSRFIKSFGNDVWPDVFEFRMLPVLDIYSKEWLLRAVKSSASIP